MDVKRIREDFPILKREIKGNKLVYLDNAATTQKPSQVINAIKDYYENYNSNIHRGIHKMSEEATIAYEEAHKKVSKFIGSKFEETIFTKGTTESLNLLASILKNKIKRGDEIVLTQMEHHSNIVPWQQLAKEKGAKIKYIEVNSDGTLKTEQFSQIITSKTKIVSAVHMSNVLGTINQIKELGKIAHENKSLFIIDAAQSIPHMTVDVKKINCDFLAFSAHKMLGPTGIGGLYGKKELLEELPPFQTGGDMIRQVTFKEAVWNDLPWKYEAGTPNIAGGIGFGADIDYLKKIGLENIQEHEEKLIRKTFKTLERINGVEIYGPRINRGAVFSFNIKGIHSHDLASLLDDYGIAVRAGHHCAMPLMQTMNIHSSVRASFYLYNTEEEVEKLAEGLKKASKIFA